MELFVRLLVGNYEAIKKKNPTQKRSHMSFLEPMLQRYPGLATRQAGQVSGCRGRANLLRV